MYVIQKENIIYEKLLSDKLSVNLGYVYENMVAQILSANGHGLYYYTFFNERSKEGRRCINDTGVFSSIFAVENGGHLDIDCWDALNVMFKLF